MRQVGHGNSFLTNPHTIANFRKQMHIRDKMAEMIYRSSNAREIKNEAHKEVQRILKDHEVPRLDKEVLRRGNEIVKDYERTKV